MFKHSFKYALKTLFKNKSLIFWSFAFPIILSTFFNMAFSNLSKIELEPIDIAIIETDEFKNNDIFKSAFENLSDENNEERLFNTTYTNEEEAKELLESDEIIGYMKLVDNEPKLVFNKNGINQTIFKYVSEEIVETSSIIENISEEEIKKEIISGNYNIDYEAIYKNAIAMTETNNVNLYDDSSSKLDYAVIEFYTLIAMTCLYGGIIAMTVINQNLANMGNVGKRVSIAPTKKSITIMGSLLASYVVELIGIALLFLYTILILHVDYGNNIPLIILLACVGGLAGLSLGVAVGSLLKVNENAKIGILIGISMFCSFFAGMFGITMKYFIDKNIPIINKLDPASMITDGLYSLYYYDTLNRYWFNIISLLIFAFILILISLFGLRRQKYDSI